MPNRPVHFEIPAEDVDRAIKFYENVFGWTFQKWGDQPYWLVMTGPNSEPGINGGMMKRRDPNQPQVNTIQVADLDAMIAKVVSEGGENVVPKMPIPTVGWLAYCKDTDGNIFGMMQPDEKAG